MTKRGIYHIIVIETFTKGKLHQTLNSERQTERKHTTEIGNGI